MTVNQLAYMYTHECGELAYINDVKRRPTYHDGQPRKTWAQLSEIAKSSWRQENQTPR